MGGTLQWHYLPVFVEHDGGIEYSICEVYLDADGCVEGWTVNNFIPPSGRNIDELRSDVEHMLNDITQWKPVRFSDLEVGMRLRKYRNEKREGYNGTSV